MVENLPNETWESHPKYTNYFGSNLGRIKHIKSNGREVLNKLTLESKGYLYFGIKKDGKWIVSPKVHRFIWECFYKVILPKGMKELQINHKNEIKTDNKIENLELCTPQYNIDYSQSKAVGQYTLDGELIRVWESTNECGRNGYAQQAISACCNNKYSTYKKNIYKGYIWKYIESEL